jgi:hypothetical protein
MRWSDQLIGITLVAALGCQHAQNAPPPTELLDQGAPDALPSTAPLPPDLGRPPDPLMVPPPNGCDAPRPLVFAGGQAGDSGRTGLYGDRTNGKQCPPWSASLDMPDVVYQFTTTEVLDFAFGAGSPDGFGPNVYLRDSCAGDDLACGVAWSNFGSTLCPFNVSCTGGIVPELPAGTHYLWIDGEGQKKLPYTLQAYLAAVRPGDGCTNPLVEPTEMGFNVNGDLAGLYNNLHKGPNGGYGPDVVYQFTTTAKHDINVYLRPAAVQDGFRALLELRQGRCGDYSAGVIPQLQANTYGGSITATAQAQPPGTYYLWIATSDPSPPGDGRYLLIVDLQLPTP